MIISLSGSSAAPPAAVGIAKVIYRLKLDRLIPLNKMELADAGAFRNLGMSDGNGREAPYIVIPAVAMFDDADAVRHDDAVVLAGGGPRHHLGIVAFRQLHRNTQRDDLELQRKIGRASCRERV